MNVKLIKLAIFAMAAIWGSPTSAALIAQEISTASLNLINYQNSYQSGFTRLDDHFQMVDANDPLGAQVLDRSLNQSDQLGILQPSFTGKAFVISDTKNSDNSTGEAIASWIFDVSNAINLAFSINVAAMGDFESSDSFSLSYQFDNQRAQELFAFNANEASSQQYRLASGAQITLDDPLAYNGQQLSNEFNSFHSTLLGQGSQLSVHLKANFDGGSEVAALSNLKIFGDIQSANKVQVSEPNMRWFMLVLVCVIGFMRKQ